MFVGVRVGSGEVVGHGGGIYLNTDYSTTVTNCIVWENGADPIRIPEFHTPKITYCDVQGGFSG